MSVVIYKDELALSLTVDAFSVPLCCIICTIRVSFRFYSSVYQCIPWKTKLSVLLTKMSTWKKPKNNVITKWPINEPNEPNKRNVKWNTSLRFQKHFFENPDEWLTLLSIVSAWNSWSPWSSHPATSHSWIQISGGRCIFVEPIWHDSSFLSWNIIMLDVLVIQLGNVWV